MHFVVSPDSSILAAITPSVNAIAVDVVVDEVTGVDRAISPVESAFTILFSLFILALVASTVWPNFFALAMLFVFVPHALVLGSISVVINSVAMRLVVLPFSVVDISISVDQTPSAVGLVKLPVAFVQTAVDPSLDSFSIFTVFVVPFPLILGSVVQNYEHFLYALNTVEVFWLGFVIEGRQSRTDFYYELTRFLNLSLR